jgi:hypothetical protein
VLIAAKIDEKVGALTIRAMALLLSIPEHKVSQQTRRPERKVRLDFPMAYRDPDPNPIGLFSPARLHMTVL